MAQTDIGENQVRKNIVVWFSCLFFYLLVFRAVVEHKCNDSTIMQMHDSFFVVVSHFSLTSSSRHVGF